MFGLDTPPKPVRLPSDMTAQYYVRVGNRNVEINNAGDALAVGDAVRELDYYRRGKFGYVLPREVFWSLILLACAIDTLIVYALYKLLG